MKDEIKKILDKLNKKAEHYILYNYEVKLLLDYITNLQNKIKDLEDTIIDKHECIEAQNDTITNLQEENKMYAQLKDEYEDIIEKAIEYCGLHTRLSAKDLLNILEGSDKE